MNIKTLVSLALLLGIGAALHFIIPGFFLGMKPDMMLLMMFLAIVLFPEKKNVLVVALACGLLSALTTTFPLGQIPNIIDKLVTASIFYFLIVAFRKFSKTVVGVTVFTVIGTLISGTVFLGSANIFFSLPGNATFLGLVIAVVLPAMLLNGVVIAIIYPIVTKILKRPSHAAEV